MISYRARHCKEFDEVYCKIFAAFRRCHFDYAAAGGFSLPVISSAVEKSNYMVRSTEGGLPLAKGAAEHSEAEGFAPTDMRSEF